MIISILQVWAPDSAPTGRLVGTPGGARSAMPAAPRFARIAMALVVAFVIAGCGGSTPKLTRLAPDAAVLAFGDSLTFGTGTTPDKSYPAALERKIGRKVIAAGIPGEVSASGLARLPEVLDEVKPRLLILCHGGNDMLRKLPTREAAANLRAMVTMARSRGIEVLLLGVPSPGLFLSTADHYDEIAKDMKLAYEGKAIASILSDTSLKADAVHPNAQGYQRLADAVAEVLKKGGAIQ
jgi:acyl-CoA thioesterase-1